jgi:hypothetical protein
MQLQHLMFDARPPLRQVGDEALQQALAESQEQVAAAQGAISTTL